MLSNRVSYSPRITWSTTHSIVLSAVVVGVMFAVGGCGGSGALTTTSSTSAKLLAQDLRAETAARSAQTAIETYAVERDGSYAGADVDALVRIEPTLEGDPLRVSASRSKYGIAARSESGTFFAVAREANGTLQFKCNVPGKGDCPRGGQWER